MPAALTLLAPLTQVHSFERRSNFQRSLSWPAELAETRPVPPNSQRWPSAPIQAQAAVRAPGVLTPLGKPRAP